MRDSIKSISDIILTLLVTSQNKLFVIWYYYSILNFDENNLLLNV